MSSAIPEAPSSASSILVTPSFSSLESWSIESLAC